MVFISYRRSDSIERAHLLKNILLSNGYDSSAVFLDMHDDDTSDFTIRCKNALLKSDVVVLVVSKDSFTDRGGQDYYYDEINCALDNHKKIVPIVFDGLFDERHLPSQFVAKNLHLVNAINYSSEFHKEFEEKFVKSVRDRNPKDIFSKLISAFKMPALVLTLYAGVALLGGVLRYVLDSYFMSDDKILTVAADHIMKDEDGEGYLYPLSNVVYLYTPGEDVHMYPNSPVSTDDNDHYLRINPNELGQAGFWAVSIALIYEISKVHVKQTVGAKKLVVYVLAGAAIMVGIGFGFVVERMIYPVYQSRLIRNKLDDPSFWEQVIARRSSQPWINRKF